MIEEVIDALKTLIVADLPAMLDTIDAEKADRIILEDILTDNIFTYEQRTLQNLPALVLIAQKSPPNQMISGTSYSPTDFTHSIYVVCIVGDTNKEKLTRRSFRYLDSLWRIIKSTPRLGREPEVIDTIITDHAHLELYGKGGDYRKDFYLKLSVKERITV